jgi:hypothetical protein
VNSGGTFMCVRSTGATETFGPGEILTVSNDSRSKSIPPNKQLDREFCKAPLCDSCSKIDIIALISQAPAQTAFLPNFERLCQSSKYCPLCALVALTLADEFSFQSDYKRPVTFEPMINGESIEIRFPSKEENYENWQSARSSRLYVYTNCAANSGKSSAFEDVSSFLISSAVDIPSGLKCRLPRDPHNPVIARYWLSECLRSHEKCQANSKSVLQANRPFRLVNVSLADVDGDPYLEEGATEGDYLTLSYCWGDPSTVTTTTKESLEEFKHRIPFASLSRIFKDAIEFTRLLGIKYIWIDALCIVQDSPEDKTREIPRMADIYAASLLTLSACRATSGESRLFEPRVVHNLVKLPVQRAENPNALLYVTNQDLYGFSDDVPEGNLGSRGWCFQERLLTTRLLHFGKDQLHWECHEALQSESNTKEFWYDDLISSDDCKLREKFVSDIVFQEPLAHPSEPLGPNATEEANAR